MATRPPIARIAALHRLLRSNAYPNARTIGEELEVCRRTVLRDVEFMRDRLSAPIEFDPIRNGYFYTDPDFRLPVMEVTQGELLALVLAERAFQQYRGTPYGPDLARAVRKLAAGLGGAVTVDLGDLAGLADDCSFLVSAPESIDPELFRDLMTSVRERRRVSMRYWTASRDAETTRAVDPLHLGCVDGRWYLIAFCHLRNEVRTFAASRIREIAATGETFDRPADFRFDEYLSGAFGVIRGETGETHHVRLRFTGATARYLGDRTWHPSQTTHRGDHGELILSFELSSLIEIERFALSWGPDCEVLEPPESRARVAAAAAATAILYSAPSNALRHQCE